MKSYFTATFLQVLYLKVLNSHLGLNHIHVPPVSLSNNKYVFFY